MPRFILAQLRHRAGRAVALLLGVLVATTGFTVLTSSTATSRLQVTETVNANSQAAYDILVRPKDARTTIEEDRGLVRPNFLSGQFGGITMAQYAQVKQVSGVEVAAPIGMAGYAQVAVSHQVDLTELVDRDAERQLFRLTPTWLADRGLTVLDDTPQYVYVTRRPLIPQLIEPTSTGVRYADGTVLPYTDACINNALEAQEDGRKVPLCVADHTVPGDGLSDAERVDLHVHRLRPDGKFGRLTLPETASDRFAEEASDRLIVNVLWPVLILVAAIDPEPEAALVGLDRAMDSGRYLRAGDSVQTRSAAFNAEFKYQEVPALVATRSYLDETVSIDIERLGRAAAGQVPGVPLGQFPERFDGVPGVDVGTVDRPAGEVPIDESRALNLDLLIQPGDPRYDASDDVLRPEVTAPHPEAFSAEGGLHYPVPIFAAEAGFRPLTPVSKELGGDFPTSAGIVGRFDPQRLRGFAELTQVPLETYQAPAATGADQRSRDLLHGQPLIPNSNPAGYLATPPLVLTTLDSLLHLFRRTPAVAAPLSAIRVRVADVHGVDPVSRERVRRVAEEIAVTTGLDVDITVGSSPAPQIVELAAGKFGRPSLLLSENWSKKGVAVTITQAIDRKSAVLFGLVLAVCVLFLANAVTAAVRDRRSELAVLACLGWPRRRLAAVIAGEVAAVGLLAGLAAAPLAPLLGRLFGIAVPGRQSWLAVPVALGLALLAALVPAWRASRTHPAAAINPLVRPTRRSARRRRSMFGLAIANLSRRPGRTFLGALALAVAIAATTLLAGVTWAFHGTVTGSLLGDAVSLRVRGVDTVAVAATVLLGLAAVADVLYLNIRERASELAALSAAGWSAGALGRLIAYEGLGIGILGAVTGAVAGLGGVAWFAGALPVGLLWSAGAVALGGILLAGLAAFVPAMLQRRIPISLLLANE